MADSFTGWKTVLLGGALADILTVGYSYCGQCVGVGLKALLLVLWKPAMWSLTHRKGTDKRYNTKYSSLWHFVHTCVSGPLAAVRQGMNTLCFTMAIQLGDNRGLIGAMKGRPRSDIVLWLFGDCLATADHI